MFFLSFGSGPSDIDSRKNGRNQIKNETQATETEKELFFHVMKRMSLHKMIHPWSLRSFARAFCVSCVLRSVFSFCCCCFRSPGRFVTILRASAHVIWICVILLLRTINYIFMVIRQEFITNVAAYTFSVRLIPTLSERGIIIRAAKSVDNLQRIVIQNGQPLLIKHCPKCRAIERQRERGKAQSQCQEIVWTNVVWYVIRAWASAFIVATPWYT